MTSMGENAVLVPIERKWHSLPPTYAPSLVFSHGKKDRDQTFCTVFDQLCHVRSVPEMRGARYVASCHGWLILQSYHVTGLCYLFNPVSLTKIHLPPLPHNSFSVGALTCKPSDSNCFVVLYSRRKMSLIFCQIGATHWIEKNLRRDKKIRSLMYGSCDAISCNGKIYLNFFDSMLVISLHDTSAFVDVYEAPEYLDLQLPGCEFMEEFLVESCGEVFKVIAIQWEESRDRIRYCEVLKLDFSTMEFGKVDSIGDRIFLISQCSASLSTDGLGVKGNRIYILVPGHTIIHIFAMDDGSVTTSAPCLERVPHWRGPFWMVPNCKPRVVSPRDNKDVVQFEKSQEDGQHWKNLGVELVELILQSLSLGDSIRFRLTCKTWIPINPPARSNLALVDSNIGTQQLPWLLSFPHVNKGLCKFYHPIYSDSFIMNIPELSNAIILEAKYGWSLMLREEKWVFFFNPLTTEIVELPGLESCYSLSGISFSSPPTSSDCIVFGFRQDSLRPNRTELLVYLKCEDDGGYPWRRASYVECEFMGNCNPVYYDGVFYCLSKDGKVATFDPKEEDENLAWKILPVAPVFSYTKWKDFQKPVQCFILEHEGDILSVFAGIRRKPILVYKLDATRTKWQRQDCFGDKLAFLSPTGCMLLPAVLKGIQNRIYFSTFHEENNMFYSLSDGQYRCFKCVYCGKHCKGGCKKLGNCTWIQLSS